MKRKIYLSALLLATCLFAFGQGFNVLNQPSSLNIARISHAAVLLPNGKVLVVGGHSTGFALTNTAEIYDPQDNTWTLHILTNNHDMMALAKLNNGNLMFMGGCSSGLGVGQSTVTTIYDPANNAFSNGPTMTRARTNTTAATLTSGNILVMGNWYNTSDAELYVAATNQFQSISSVPLERSVPLILPANDGSAFILGGSGVYGGVYATQVDYFDPQNNSITLHSSEIIASLPGYTTAWFSQYGLIENSRLSNGNYVFMAWLPDNGLQHYKIFQFDPASKTFSELPLDQQLPSYHNSATGPYAHYGNLAIDSSTDYIYVNSYNTQSGYMEEHLYTIDAQNGVLCIPTGETSFGYQLGSGSRVLLGSNIFYTGGTQNGSNFSVTSAVQLLSPTNTFDVHEYYPETKGVEVYPNPVNTASYQINLPNNLCYKVVIYDMAGMLLKSLQLDRGTYQITLEKGSIKPGMYIIEVHHNFGKQSAKVIFQ